MFLLNVTALFVRVLGIYLILTAFIRQRAMASSLADIPDFSVVLAQLVTPGSIILGLIAVVMIMFPVSIARALIPKTSSESPSLVDGAQALEVCAYTVIGVAIFASTLPDLLENLVYLALYLNDPSTFDEGARVGIYASTAVTVMTLSIGAYLSLGALKVSKIIGTIRGRDSSPV